MKKNIKKKLSLDKVIYILILIIMIGIPVFKFLKEFDMSINLENIYLAFGNEDILSKCRTVAFSTLS